MKNEFEAKFLNIDPESLRQTLSELAFSEIQKKILFRRITYLIPGDTHNKWLRLRDEGDVVTLTVKVFTNTKIDGLFENEIIVDSFDNTLLLLDDLNLKRKSYQENYRNVWSKQGIKVMIDYWPGLSPYCEIEGVTPAVVQETSSTLGFEWNEAFFGTTDLVYEKLLGLNPEYINTHPSLNFETKF